MARKTQPVFTEIRAVNRGLHNRMRNSPECDGDPAAPMAPLRYPAPHRVSVQPGHVNLMWGQDSLGRTCFGRGGWGQATGHQGSCWRLWQYLGGGAHSRHFVISRPRTGGLPLPVASAPCGSLRSWACAACKSGQLRDGR